MGCSTKNLARARAAFLFGQVGIVLDFLNQFKIGFVGRVVFDHVENIALLDRLAHAVEVEGFRLPAIADTAEQLQGLALGGGGKGKKADVGLGTAVLP